MFISITNSWPIYRWHPWICKKADWIVGNSLQNTTRWSLYLKHSRRDTVLDQMENFVSKMFPILKKGLYKFNIQTFDLLKVAGTG